MNLYFYSFSILIETPASFEISAVRLVGNELAIVSSTGGVAEVV